MTIASTPRRAGPFATNGVQTNFAFAFKVFDEGDLRVVRSEDGVDTDLALGTDYTVSLNADQDSAPGGTVTLLDPPNGPEITLLGDMEVEQPVVITNRGGFYPRVFNDVFDRLTIYIQQLEEKMTRAALRALGTPVAGKYLVTDANGDFTYSDGTGADAGLRTDLAASTGAALVGVGGGGTVQDALDALDAAGITGDLAVSVGAGGDYETLADFCAWLKTVVVTGTITATLTGSHTVDAQDARYAGSGKVILQGAAFGGGQGAYAITDLPTYSTAVADEAAFATKREAIKTYLRTQFNASIVLEGNNDLAGHSGIIGAFHFKRMLIEGNGRYTVDNGFVGSHANSESGSGALVFEDCAVVGGVWGGIGSGCYIKLNGTKNLFACQISGGPLDCINGRIVCNPSTLIYFYFPLVTTPFANMPQVGVNLDRASFQCGIGKLKVWGPYKHLFYTNGQCTIIAPDVETTHVTQLATVKDNSFADLAAFVGNNANPAETSATAGAEQTNITGNSTSKVFIFAGRGSVVNCDGGTINDSDGLYAYVLADGGTVQTFNKITATNSRVSVLGGLGEFAAINYGKLIGKFGEATPIAGGNNWYFADRGGIIILEANDGTLGYNIPRNSMKNGSAIFDMANPDYSDGAVWVGGVRMLKAQGAAVADPTGGATVDAEARAAIAALIDRLEAHRLIAT